MDAIVKYSALNPLATCFVPGKYKVSNCVTESWKDLKGQFAAEVLKDEVLQENVTILQSCTKLSHLVTHDIIKTSFISTRDNPEYLAVISNSDSLKSSVAFNDGEIAILLVLLLTTLLQFCPNDLTKDVTEYCDVGIDGLTEADGYHDICIDDLTEAKQHHDASNHELASNEDHNVINSIETEYGANMGKTSIRASETGNCNCPPMFGYIIPYDFFGNPFNLNPCCNKKCVHVGHFSDSIQGRKRCNTYPAANGTIPLNLDCYQELEKCTEEFGKVIYDVCRIVSESIDDNYVDVSKQTNKETEMLNRTVGSGLPRTLSNSTEDSLEMEETNSLLEYSDLIEGTNMQHDMPMINNSKLANECPAVDSEDEGISLMDHQGNMHASKSPFDCEPQITCYPPCSVWCDSHILVPNCKSKRLPAFEEFTSRMLNEKRLKQSGQKPPYKRSLSTNDASKREGLGFKFSSCPDYERLTNINLPYYAIEKYNICDGFQMEKRSIVPMEANKETTWGPFDGIDSLWQPLPDCISSDESMLKQNGHKRIRELKRQRSLN